MVSGADFIALQSLEFNSGDLIILVAAIGHGSYANTLRIIPHDLSFNLLLFGVCVTGCIGLLPFNL